MGSASSRGSGGSLGVVFLPTLVGCLPELGGSPDLRPSGLAETHLCCCGTQPRHHSSIHPGVLPSPPPVPELTICRYL